MDILKTYMVRDEVGYGVENGFIPENEEDLWSSYTWAINQEDIISFIRTVKQLGMSQLWTGNPNLYIKYTEGDLEDQVEELGFDGGYIIENLDTNEEYFVGWYYGDFDHARELAIVPRLWFKK